MKQFPVDVLRLGSSDDGPRKLSDIQVGVAHTNEPGPYKGVGLKPGSIEGLLDFCNDRKNGASYQMLIDRLGKTGRMNDDGYIPWSAGATGNRKGLHVCLLGWSAQSRAEWLMYDEQLTRLAEMMAHYYREMDLPIVKLSPADLRAGRRGWCSHDDVGKAWGQSDHTDPGPYFPWDYVIGKAKALVAGTAFVAAPASSWVIGEIAAKYKALGGEKGFLGKPLIPETGTPDGVGRYNHFEGGSIYWSPATGARFIKGEIGKYWASKGWEAGKFKYPITDEIVCVEGVHQYFQGGGLFWNKTINHVSEVM